MPPGSGSGICRCGRTSCSARPGGRAVYDLTAPSRPAVGLVCNAERTS
jgi:hypothetical protein